MQSVKNLFIFVIFVFLAVSAYAEGNYGGRHLTAQELERVKAVRELLGGVDTKPLKDTIHELEINRYPETNIEMSEAMAKAYTDIVKETNVVGQKKKEWLYSMVCLNMAYLQFGGSQAKPGSTTELNRLIRQKLIKYLPPNALKQPGFVYSLE